MLRLVIRALVSLLILAAPRGASAEWLYALTTTNHLGVFEASDPTRLIATIAVTGLDPSERLVTIDFRPRDGQLYGIAVRNDGQPMPNYTARLYRVHMLTGVATPRGASTLPMDYADVGFDFDAHDDVARVVTSLGLNYRVSPDTGEMVDSDPNVPGPQMDKKLQGGSSITAIAYSNNYTGTAATTVYAIDIGTRAFSRIGGVGGTPTPNDGAVTRIGTQNSLPFETQWGLDIVMPNRAYASLRVGDDTDLRRIDITLGGWTLIGKFALVAGSPVIDIAVQHRPVTMYGLTQNNRLVTFRSHHPGEIRSDVPIAGLLPGEELQAIDVRPETGHIYAISNEKRLLRINPGSGAATAVMEDSGVIWSPWAGLSFDPVTGRLRGLDLTSAQVEFDLTMSPIANLGPPLLHVNGQALVKMADVGHMLNPFDRTSRFYAVSETSEDLLWILGDTFGAEHDIDRNVLTRTGFDIDPASNVFYLMNEVPNAVGWFLYALEPGLGKAALMERVGPAPGVSVLQMQDMAVALPGAVRVEKASVDVDEPAGTVTVKVLREGGASGPFSIDYATQAGSAEANADFTPVSGTLIFLDGETSKEISIAIRNDATYDAPIETFTFTLSAPTLGVTLVMPAATTIRIADDEKLVGQLPTVTITAPTTNPTFDVSGLLLIDLAGTASDDGRVVEVTWSDGNGVSGTAQGTTHWLISGFPARIAPATITVTARDDLGQVSSDTITLTSDVTRELTYVLAEGATGGFFDLDILLANPGAIPAPVMLTFLKEDGTTQTETRTLPPTSRTTVRVDEIPGLEGTTMSTVITSPDPIVVERTMRWAEGAGYGAHTEKAVDGAAETWYFAEGSQGFFSTYLLLANPLKSENTATVEYLREGESPVTRTYTLPPRSRTTIDASTDDALVNRSFGMTVTFATPGVAERAMYFGAQPFWKAGHESAGVTLPSTTWFLAEGATGPYFETFVLLSNPQSTAAEVTLTFLIAGGAPITTTKTVPARGRLTVNIEQEDPALANVAVATQVASSVPIVVERAQYWPFTFDQWYEAHNSFGVIATGKHWGLAEGRVGGPENYETYILLANPGTEATDVRIVFLRTDGTTVEKQFTVPAQSRLNVATGPGGPVPELANEEFSAVIMSEKPIAVERAMYASPGGLSWSAGTNATATRLVIE